MFHDQSRWRWLSGLATLGTWVEVVPPVPKVATHWQDDMVLAAALAGEADYLVTGDSELLVIGSYAAPASSPLPNSSASSTLPGTTDEAPSPHFASKVCYPSLAQALSSLRIQLP